MKKKILLILACALLFVGCSKKIEGISEQAYSDAVTTIDIMDEYLSGDEKIEDTIHELYGIEINMDFSDEEYILSLERDEDGNFIDSDSPYPRDYQVYVKIFDIRVQMSASELFEDDELKEKSIKNAIEIKNELADLINYKD